MSEAAAITDEKLVAWLDGTLDAARHAQIDAAVEQDPALGERAARLDVDLPAIRAAMDGLAAMAPIQRLEAGLRPPVSRARVRMRDWTRMAAMLVLGVGLGYAASGFRATTDSGWHVAVANYQALYSRATLAPLENSEPALRAQVAAISEQLGLTIPYESLLVPGLTFKRAQTLSFQGKPLVQFAYTDADGAPVAFCVMRDETGATPVHLGIVAGLNAVSWSHGGYGFIVIGDLGQSALRQAAEQLSRAI